MKKLLLTMLAFCSLWTTANATLILHESFDRTAGTLNKGTSQANMGTNTTDWWSYSGTSSYISVVENSLSYDGYATAAGNKVELLGNGADDLRQFSPITSGKVYAAAIINVDSLKNSLTTDYFFCLGDASATKMYARLQYLKSDTGFKLGVTKNTESGIGYSEAVYDTKTNYLVVVEYQFVDGDKNDTVRLYINPTKDTKTATTECVQVKNNAEGTNTMGAGGKDDATQIASVNLRKGTNTPGRVYVDEIKVATAWDDLFESGDTPDPTPTATITTSPKKLAFGGVYTDGTQHSLTFTVSGTDLTGDITLASDNAELVLDKTTLTKAEAEADGGAKVTATLTAVAAGEQTATITLSSTGATPVTIAASWTAIAITKSATIAELKTGIAADDGTNPFLLTGEAVVTYSEKGSYGESMYYIEDATGAVRIDDWFGDCPLNVGDKIKDALVYKGYEETSSGLPLSFNSVKPTIVSTGNEWTPKVVTLKDLQDNAADYLLELVKVEGVTLDNTEANYKAGNNAISQNGTSGAIGLTSDNTLVGTAKPAKADIVGISYYTSGYNIRVRTAADIVAKTDPTSIETISLDQLTGEYEIYTVSGQRTNALQAGVNIIRQGDKTYKVIR